MEFKTKIDEDGNIHSQIHCECNSLDDVRNGLEKTIAEWTRQLEDKKKPLYCPPKLNFLYAYTPNGDIVSLYNGILNTTVSQTSDSFARSFGSITNPPSSPSIFLGSCCTTLFEYELVFENPVPDEWLKSEFYLRIGYIKFRIVSSTCDSNGNYTTIGREQKYFSK